MWFETPCKNCNGNPDTYPNGTDNFAEQIDSTNDIAALFENKE